MKIKNNFETSFLWFVYFQILLSITLKSRVLGWENSVWNVRAGKVQNAAIGAVLFFCHSVFGHKTAIKGKLWAKGYFSSAGGAEFFD